MRVRWTRAALRSLDAHLAWIARDRPETARRVAVRLRQAVARLAEQPRLGRPGRVAGTRELVLRGLPYLVAYRVVEGQVEILRVLHGAQSWPESF